MPHLGEENEWINDDLGLGSLCEEKRITTRALS